MIGEEPQLGRFGIVANVHVRFERSLVAEDIVVVRFVGADGDVDGRVQVHPRDVAVVIVVGAECRGARGQELLERRVVRQPGCFLQQPGRFLQIRAILPAIGDRAQLVVLIAANCGEKTLGLLALGLGKRLRPGFELLPRHVFGIEIRARQFLRRDAGKKRCMVVNLGPRRFVQPEIIQPGLAEGRDVFTEPGVEGMVAAPHLREEYIVQNARGFNQLRQRLGVARRELGCIHAQLSRLETRDHFLKLRKIGDSGGSGQHRPKYGNEEQKSLHCSPS